MSQYENDNLNYQADDLNKTSNQNKTVWDGGTYSDKPTTERDVQQNDNSDNASGGTRSMTPTKNTSDGSESSSLNADDDEDFDDTVGEDNLADEDGFNANSDDPTERELTKSWLGNEKSVHDAEVKGLEGEPMGGYNFGTTELEQKNNRDASSSEHHSLGLGSSALNQPSEEISNPAEVADGSDNPDRKKTYD